MATTSSRTVKRRPRTSKVARRDVEPESTATSYGTEIGAVVAIGILAAVGILLWRGRDSLPPLPQLPAPDDVRDSVRDSWKSAMKRLPRVDPEKLSDVSRGFDALRHIFSRA